MCSSRSHWENIYTTKSETTVSWFQLHPERSLESIEAVSPVRKASVIDVGGGASTLVDDLLVRGLATSPYWILPRPRWSAPSGGWATRPPRSTGPSRRATSTS